MEELQALVASLAMAVEFAQALTKCMPTITQVGAQEGGNSRHSRHGAVAHLRALLLAGLTYQLFTEYFSPHIVLSYCPLLPMWLSVSPPLSRPAAAGLLHHQRRAGEHRHAADLQAV